MTRGFIDGRYQDGELRGLTFLAGISNMGKTTEMARLCEQCSGGVAFFDSAGDHGELLRGYKTVSQPGALKEALRAGGRRRFRLRYLPNDFPERHFVEFCRIVRVFGWMIVAVDEIDLFCGAEHGPKGMPVELYDMVHFGRHTNESGTKNPLSMLVTARDPASLSIRFRSQCETFRIFRTDEERYVQYFAGRIGKANAARLRSLPPYHYLLWRSGSPEGTICGGRRNLARH